MLLEPTRRNTLRDAYIGLSFQLGALGDRIEAIACALTAVRLDPRSPRCSSAMDRALQSTVEPETTGGRLDLHERLLARKRRLDNMLLKEAHLPLCPPKRWPIEPSAAIDAPQDPPASDLDRRMEELREQLERQRQQESGVLDPSGILDPSGVLEGLFSQLVEGTPRKDQNQDQDQDETEAELELEFHFHNLGNDYYKIARFAEAIDCYNHALELRPDLLETHFNRGLARTRRQEYLQARQDLDKVIALNDNLPETYYTRGLIFEYQERFDEAIADYDKALEVDPEYERAAAQRTIAVEKKGQGSGGGKTGTRTDKEGRIRDFGFCLLDTETTFDHVGGCRQAKREMQKAVCYLRGDPILSEWGAELPRGILMVGPPGVGKSHLVRALAGEIDCPCYAPPPTVFQDMWAGNTEKNIRTLWNQATSHEKAILLIDEFDGLASRRSDTRSAAGENFYNRVVVTLLNLMDGLDSSSCRLMVIGTTNRLENIDPAFLRPGRFDHVIHIASPGAKDLAEIWLILLELAEQRASRVDFLEAPLREAVHATRGAWLAAAHDPRAIDRSGILRLARLAQSRALTGAHLREIIRRTVDERVMASIECGIDLGSIRARDLEQALASYVIPAPSPGSPGGGAGGMGFLAE